MSKYKITGREILFSTIIICAMVGLGVWISNPILRSSTESAMKVTSSVKVNDNEKFTYICRTNVGDFLAEGTLKAIDPVSIDELDGQYLKIKKVKEKYTRHTRRVVTSDGKGHTRTRVQTYWSWDHVKTLEFVSDSVVFLNQRFLLDSIKYHIGVDYKETQKESSYIRYKYYIHPTETNGVMVGVCDKKVYTDLSFKENETIDKIVESAENKIHTGPIIFWVLWAHLIVGIVVLFYWAENKWLED